MNASSADIIKQLLLNLRLGSSINATPPANIIPAGATYPGAGPEYSPATVPGTVYIYTAGVHEVQLTNDDVVVASGATFTAGTAVVITGTVAGTTVTASLKEPAIGWPIYASFIPTKPDVALCVYDTAGRQDGRLMPTGKQIIHPGVQVLVRGPVYPTTFQKASEIAEALDSQRRAQVSVGSSVFTVHNISRQGDLLSLGMEEEGDRRRHLFTINAVLTVTENT